jgi:hypothetical protein
VTFRVISILSLIYFLSTIYLCINQPQSISNDYKFYSYQDLLDNNSKKQLIIDLEKSKYITIDINQKDQNYLTILRILNENNCDVKICENNSIDFYNLYIHY